MGLNVSVGQPTCSGRNISDNIGVINESNGLLKLSPCTIDWVELNSLE